jgi:PAT family beta-lactamase induction signal transducer AmpG
VPRTVVNASTGWVVEQTGWYTFFLLCTVLALPGMALLLRVAPWNEPTPTTDRNAAGTNPR